MIRVDGFTTSEDNAKYADMVTRIARGKKMDLQTRGINPKGLVPTHQDSAATNAYKASLVDLIELRERLAPNTIRRTLFSIDFEGKPLSGMDPYQEVQLRVRPYPHEAMILEKTARVLSGTTKGDKFWGLKVTVHWHIF